MKRGKHQRPSWLVRRRCLKKGHRLEAGLRMVPPEPLMQWQRKDGKVLLEIKGGWKGYKRCVRCRAEALLGNEALGALPPPGVYGELNG